MMKVIALVLAIAVAAFPSTSAACITFYTVPPAKGTTKVYGAYTYTGITAATDIENYNNMLYYSSTAASAATATPDGRLTGSLSLKSGTGIISMEFFKTKSWLTTYFGKGPTEAVANVVTGGTGCFSGYQGTATRTIFSDTSKGKVFKWSICPTATKTCSAAGA
jgi:hypothetical protein